MGKSQRLAPANSRWRSLVSWMLIMSLCIQSGSAVKERFPTATPSLFPTVSAVPSDPPSTLPTQSPAPSATPSTSHAPSLSPTVAPTHPPSSSPTLYPTKLQTASPTMGKNIPLPVISIDVVVSDEEGATISEKDLETAVTSFIKGVLEAHSGSGTFERATFNFKLIVSSFRRRKLSAGLSIRLEGEVFYASQAPPPNDLTEDLQVYFAAWGISELETHLQGNGLTTAQVAAVTIDGDVVKPATSPSSISAGAQLGQSDQQGKHSTSPAVIAGLVAGCAVLVGALAFLLVKSRSGKSHPMAYCYNIRKFMGERVPRPVQEVPKTTEDALTSPQTVTQTSVTPVSEEDDEHSIGDSSAELSIYTTDESVVKNYNAKRLDKVIAIARHQADQMQERVAI